MGPPAQFYGTPLKLVLGTPVDQTDVLNSDDAP